MPEADFVNRTNLNWSWAAATDVGLGVQEYRVIVGTAPGSGDVLANYSVGNSTSFTYVGAPEGTAHYLSVQARDGANLWGNWSSASSGMTVDLSPPRSSKPLAPSAWVTVAVINWSWAPFADNGSGTASYDIRVGTTPGGSNVLNGVATNQTSYSLLGAAEGRPYYLTVRGRDGVGNVGPWSVPSDGVSVDLTPPPSPAKPVGPEGFANLSSGTWIWPDIVDLQSGLGFYEAAAGSSPSGSDILALTSLFQASLTVGSLPDGQTVYLRVRAVDAAGNVGNWSEASTPLMTDRTSPQGPVFASTPPEWSNTSALAWVWALATDSFSGVAGYLVRLGTSPMADDVIRETSTAADSFAVSSAPAGGSLYLSVRAVDAAGNLGPWLVSASAEVDLAAPSIPVVITSPTSPTNSSLLRWSWAVSDDAGSGVAGYHVRIGTVVGGGDLLGWTFVFNASFEFTAGVSGREHFFSVRAVDRVGWASAASAAQGPLLVDLEPPFPVHVFVDAGLTRNSSATVGWEPSSDPGGSGLAGYEIEAYSGDNMTATTLPPSARSSSHPGEDGREYQYRVRAFDRAGNRGPWSSNASVLFDRSPPTPLTGIRSTVQGSRIEWSWSSSSDEASGLSGYLVSVGTTPGAADVENRWFTRTANFTIVGQPGATYYLTAAVVDAAGNEGGPYSSEGGATVPNVQSAGPTDYTIWILLLAVAAVAVWWIRSSKGKVGGS